MPLEWSADSEFEVSYKRLLGIEEAVEGAHRDPLPSGNFMHTQTFKPMLQDDVQRRLWISGAFRARFSFTFLLLLFFAKKVNIVHLCQEDVLNPSKRTAFGGNMNKKQEDRLRFASIPDSFVKIWRKGPMQF